ncbi:MAG: hypothetical protein M1839_001562 [Geoglossum umbratile]|nr:MAG: hypothetical protein M1839_001562 [Geoglossum umbratile]
MGLSKSNRIVILLCIDTAFFLLELIVGSAVHSLALVADSFHMLNDVISLCVGYWAVKVAKQRTNSKRYTYGWQRAETLGALVNGVFLVALCLSIFLEAIQRFFEPQIVRSPKLILVVGSLGLLSNILGLLLFHDHGHSHGGHGHSHTSKDGLAAAEAGHSHRVTSDTSSDAIADETGNIEDTLPEAILKRSLSSSGSRVGDKDEPKAPTSPISTRKCSRDKKSGHTRQSSSRSRHFSSVDELNPHPASFRKDFIAASRMEGIASLSASDSEVTDSETVDPKAMNSVEDFGDPTDHTPLLRKSNKTGATKSKRSIEPHNSWHTTHKHSDPKSEERKGTHSHQDLNMRGVFLHVMGDALGNIGVIASALFIWLTTYSWRFYADPAISLIITAIILASAIPLCKAASRILLQAVPAGLNVDDIKDDIQELPGVVSCHHLHVWQLNDTKLVASLHIEVEFDFEGAGSAQYMSLARAVRKCLHAYGIHSSTIQPEFSLGHEHGYHAMHGLDGGDDVSTKGKGTGATPGNVCGNNGSRPISPAGSAGACLLECGDECGTRDQCCSPNLDMDRHSHDSHEH